MHSHELVPLPDSAETGDELPIPHMMFAKGEEPVGVRVLTYQSSRSINLILDALQEDEIRTIRKSVFGKLVEIASQPSFSGRFTRYILSRQLKVKKKHEVWFRFAGNPIRFSLREFAIVTGLPCGKYPKKSKLNLKRNLIEKPFWPTLFGKLELVSVATAVKMLRKKTVVVKEVRIKIACLALLSAVLLSTNINMKIAREHAEAIADLESFFSYPWGRLAFEMLITSIKERDELTLSQKSIAIKGFALAIQLVMVEAVPALTEVQQNCSSSESASDVDGDECRRKVVRKRTLSPGHARNLDAKAEVAVKSIIDDDPARPFDEENLQWSDDEEDDRVDNLLTLIKKGHNFKTSMFKGGVSMAEVERRKEVGKMKKRGKMIAVRETVLPTGDCNGLVDVVWKQLNPEIAKLEQKIEPP